VNGTQAIATALDKAIAGLPVNATVSRARASVEAACATIESQFSVLAFEKQRVAAVAAARIERERAAALANEKHARHLAEIEGRK
jgi:hypothetical protein